MKNTDSGYSNLLLITYDQFRGDWYQPYYGGVSLPNFESLSSSGWTFNRSYTTSPSCVPARMSWITGMYGSQLGVTKALEVDLPPDAPSVIRDLQSHGFFTALAGKSHFTTHEFPRDLRDEEPRLRSLGFDDILEIPGPKAFRRINCRLTDEWAEAGLLEKVRDDLESRYASEETSDTLQVRPTILPNVLYPDIWITDQAIKKIETLPENKPWLLWVSYGGPHEPFDTPKPWAGMSTDDEIPEITKSPEWIADLPENAQLRKVWEKWKGKARKAQKELFRKDYTDHLKLLDDQLGKLIDALGRRNDRKNTAIALTSDHGDLLGDADIMHKSCFLEGAVRTPWIFQPPPVVEAPCGLSAEEPICGMAMLKNVLQALRQNHYPEYPNDWLNKMPPVISEFDLEIMVVIGMKKLVLNYDGTPQWAVDLEKDPQEQNNLLQHGHGILRSKEWKPLVKTARRFFRRRQKKKWLWKDLGQEKNKQSKLTANHE
jgi:arylsulfatase